MSLRDKAQARQSTKPQPTPADELPSVIELAPDLYQIPSNGRRNQYRGRIDDYGTVRVRVYTPLSVEDQAGEILVGSIEDATSISDVQVSKDKQEYVKVEFDGTLAEGVLVLMWAPADADIDGVKLTM